jgi:transcriptional regulator with XRE-family HTH domain
VPDFDKLLTSDSVLAELGRRLEQLRLAHDKTQVQLAREAGIGRVTLQRIEHGDSVQTLSLVKLLRALGLLGGLEAAVPAALELPIAQLERARRPARRRARSHRRLPEGKPWQWGEEGGGR